MALCHLMRVDEGSVAFHMTLALLQKVFVMPCRVIPIMHSLYHSASICSLAILRAMNSDPKVDDLMVFCHFEYQDMGATWRKMRIPVIDLLVIKSVECAASQITLSCTGRPHASGIFTRMGSSVLG